MQREIKFRGKCAFSGEWRIGYYYPSKGNHIIRTDDDKESIVLGSTVGQLTPYTDKFGKSIYEGMDINITVDTCFNDINNVNGRVEFQNAWVAIVTNGNSFMKIGGTLRLTSFEPEHIEIIHVLP